MQEQTLQFPRWRMKLKTNNQIPVNEKKGINNFSELQEQTNQSPLWKTRLHLIYQ